jgi:SOS regulatory protein LexA
VQQGKTVEIPLLGIIPAGGPIEPIEDPEPLQVPQQMLSKSGRHYALKVSGTSMIEEGISDGDIIIVREQPSVENGEKAVAYLPDKNSVTLKKIYKEKSRIKLVPANKTMEPFYEKNVEIQGKVIGVLRKEI